MRGRAIQCSADPVVSVLSNGAREHPTFGGAGVRPPTPASLT
jgi:hypothetical protein